MTAPSAALQVVLLAWFAALVATLCYRMLVGAISLDGLLSSKDGRFSPERLQLLAMTIAGAATFAVQSLTDGRLYEFPEHLFVPLLVGSHSIFLIGKTLRK